MQQFPTLDVAEHGPVAASGFAVEGRNCWQRVRANRLAFLVDTEAYFQCFKAAALRARRSILILGWDVNSRTRLEFPDEARPDVPNELGPFLDHLAYRQAHLQIRVLDWDSPLMFAPDREWAPRARFDWFTHPRLCFALDAQHPLGASHHQKLVVIDDAIAFLGGIDLTDSRLDGVEHRPDDPRRQNPDGSAYGPYHDVQIAVDGAAARALATLARDRWLRATGQRLLPSPSAADCWPDGLAVDAGDVEVAITRTYPTWKGRPQIREIEAMFLDSIAGARTSVYIENQYFCCERVARAIVERLAAADSPEFVLILPQEASSWLERAAMGSKQQRLLNLVRSASAYGRFRVYGPVVGENGDVGVKVHSKLMIVDGRFLNVGSANLNNRSMGLDSECNIAVEGEPDTPTQRAVTRLRNQLLAEHLDTAPDVVAAAIDSHGSLIAAIDHLRSGGRSLRPLPEAAPDLLDTFTADLDLLDPAAPTVPEQIAHALAGDTHGQTTLRSAMLRLAAVLAALLALAALWRWGPLADVVNPASLQRWSQALHSQWTTTAVVLAAYVVGGLLMFPVMVLIVATGLIYDPVTGLIVAASGSLVSAIAGYAAGMLLGRRGLRRLAGGRLSRISRQLARRGILAMTVLRLLPVAPFTLINLAAGASHIRFRDYVGGTAIGMAPGIAVITLFSGHLWRAVHAPDAANVGILMTLLLVIVLALAFCWRHFIHGGASASDA